MLSKWFMSLCVSLLLVSCSAMPSPTTTPSPTSSPTSTPTSTPSPTSTPNSLPKVLNGSEFTPVQAKEAIANRTLEVISALKTKDSNKLSLYIHPQLGVRFSPYTYVNAKSDLVLNAAQVRTAFQDATLSTWGSYDGSGEPIHLTFANYFSKFIYSHDFAKAEKLSYNETVGKGNTVNNVREVYPTSIIVEYYFSGFDKKLEGHDWVSLRLVFEYYNQQWYLTGVVHDQWTI